MLAAWWLRRGVGLGDRLVHPGTTQAALVIGGALSDIPGGTLMGVPEDAAQVAAAEVAVGLALVISIYRKRNTVIADDIDLMKW